MVAPRRPEGRFFFDRSRSPPLGRSAPWFRVIDHQDTKQPRSDVLQRLLPWIVFVVFVRFPLCLGGRRSTSPLVGYTRSTIVAMPWPTPMHIVASPVFAPRSIMLLISVVVIRAPLAPSG